MVLDYLLMICLLWFVFYRDVLGFEITEGENALYVDTFEEVDAEYNRVISMGQLLC